MADFAHFCLKIVDSQLVTKRVKRFSRMATSPYRRWPKPACVAQPPARNPIITSLVLLLGRFLFGIEPGGVIPK